MNRRLISLDATQGDIPSAPAYVARYAVFITCQENADYRQELEDVSLLGPGWEPRAGGLHDRPIERQLAEMESGRRAALLDYVVGAGNPLLGVLFEFDADAGSAGSWSGESDMLTALSLAEQAGYQAEDLVWLELDDLEHAQLLAYDRENSRYVLLAQRSERDAPLTPQP